MLVFKERRKPWYPEKTSRSKGEIWQQIHPTYGFDARTRASATLVGGECSHLCATLAPRFILGEVFPELLLDLSSFQRSRRENSYSRPLPKSATKAGHLSFTFGAFISSVYCYHPPLFFFCVFVSAKQRRDSWFWTLKVPIKEQPEFFELWVLGNCHLFS